MHIENGRPVTKRLIDIEDELLETARRELGTLGIADTVRSALQLAATRSARVAEVEWLVSGGMAEMADRDARNDVWR
jgi:Arc/MetJ family transcription regulator